MCHIKNRCHTKFHCLKELETRGEGKYHRLSHLVRIWLQVELVQTLLDALSGGT